MSLHSFAVRVNNDKDAIYFMKQSSKRVTGPGLHHTFAEWVIFEESKTKDTRTYVVAVKSRFPDAWKIGVGLLAVPFIFVGMVWSWFYTFGLGILAVSFITGPMFRLWVLKIGLRRYGYKGQIIKINMDDILINYFKKRCDKWNKAK